MPVASQLTLSAVSWLSSSREDVQRSCSRRSRAQLRVQSFRSIMGKFVCISVFYFGIYILCAEASQNSDNSSLYRLPKNILPQFYDLFLHTNVTRGNFSYKGMVTVNLTVVIETKQVILHSENLEIINKDSVFHKVWSNESLETIPIHRQHYEDETQFYIITFQHNLIPGKYLLKLHFIGEVRDDIFGFYRSSYRNNNEIRWIGVTQFSPTFARRAFPCMDEPGFKATFQLRIGHYQNETVSSNTEQESRETTDDPNYFITTFSRTPRMSTYLLSWAIHDFHRVKSSDSRIWLWTRLDDSQLSWSLASSPALVESPKVYSTLEDWMEVKNPLQKMELIAVPDFKFHAMENWGFVTFRESSMLVRNDSTPRQNFPRILITIAHEYAHTWFGNIVTPDFWSFPWLKEGFASYFSYFITSIVHEDWRMMNLFTLEVSQMSLLSDSQDHNKILNKHDVGSSKSAAAALDFITYEKGASIVRMISEIMGEKLFKDAMHLYLKEKQFKSATPSDLYEYLDLTFNSSSRAKQLPVSIGEIIESWANQPHYPLIKATRIGPSRLHISQQIFEMNLTKSDHRNSRFWWVPLNILMPTKTNSSKFIEVTGWLGAGSTDIDLPADANEDGWFLLNSKQTSYYRTDYDKNNWEALLRVLNSDNFWHLPAIDRAILLDDAFNLARAGYKEYSQVFELAKYLKRETEYEPWVTASRAFRFLDSKLRDKLDIRLAFRRFAIDLLIPIYKQLSFKEHPLDSHLKKVHRNLILSTACYLDLEDCVVKAKSIMNDWITDENKTVPANSKDFVYCIGLLNGNDDMWINFWDRFSKTNYYSEKELMIDALACTENSSFIAKYLEFSIDPDSDIAKQHRPTIIQKILAGLSKNIEITLNYVEKNLKKIIAFRGISFLEEILSTIGQELTSQEQVNKFTLFINENANKLGHALATAQKAVKTAERNIILLNNSALKIARYLNVSTSI